MYLLIAITLTQPNRSTEHLLTLFPFLDGKLDTDYGVISVDPRDDLCAFRAQNLSDKDQRILQEYGCIIYGDPKIGPF